MAAVGRQVQYQRDPAEIRNSIIAFYVSPRQNNHLTLDVQKCPTARVLFFLYIFLESVFKETLVKEMEKVTVADALRPASHRRSDLLSCNHGSVLKGGIPPVKPWCSSQ